MERDASSSLPAALAGYGVPLGMTGLVILTGVIAPVGSSLTVTLLIVLFAIARDASRRLVDLLWARRPWSVVVACVLAPVAGWASHHQDLHGGLLLLAMLPIAAQIVLALAYWAARRPRGAWAPWFSNVAGSQRA